MINIRNVTELNITLASEEKVLLVFTQPLTCIPCRRLYPHLVRLDEKHSDITIAVVDLDTVPDAMVAYDLQSVPTVQLFNNGRHVSNIKGRTVPQLEQELNL